MTSVLDYALAYADLGIKVFRLRPMDKRPLFEGWQDEATTDPATISRWFAEQKNLNYGIPTGLANGLMVVDLDGPGAQSWYRSKGFINGAMVNTPSGPDRTHHYFRIDDIEIANSQSKLFEHVDTRGEGGYVVGPGSMLPTGTYSGDLRVIPDAPAELLAILPEKQTFESVPYEGEQVEAATPDEQRQINSIIHALESLPKVWHEGAGWHEIVYRSACWLSRMVNSGAYAVTEAGALNILMSFTPTYPDWGQEQIQIQWASARKSTLGQFAELPKSHIPNLLPYFDVANLVGPAVLELLFADSPNSDAAKWKARKTIFVACFHAGLSLEQAATLVWSSKSAAALQQDPNGLALLFSEAEKARSTAIAETGEGTEALAADERPSLTEDRPRRTDLMTAEEREYATKQEWWGTRYLDWAETRVSMMNAPYHRMNRWTILSLFFSDSGFIPAKKGPINLALFQMILGLTTTGKSEALEIMRSVIRAMFPKGDSPDIGGDASPNSLIEKLIERDGKASWFNADEAHGLLEEIVQGGSWRTGIIQKWTALYEGRVPMILRNGKKDISGIDAITFFVMHLMGTSEGMSNAMTSQMWESGFLARFVWAIGEELEATPESFLEEDQEGDVIRGYEAMPKQWAAEFEAARQKLKAYGLLPIAIGMEDDARARHVVLKRQLGKMFKGHRQEQLLKPTSIRFAITVRKCASLIAMSEGSQKISLRHELIAIEQAEEWMANIITMVNRTTESGFSRQVDECERFIASQANGEVRIERVYSRFKVEKFITDKYIAQLVAEGRITKTMTLGESFILKIKTALEAIAA